MKRMIGKHSGMWESREPCGLQNHPPESSAGGRGRPSAAASNFIPCQGSASSTVHLRSLSELSFSVPSTCTAHCRPGSQTGEGYVFRVPMTDTLISAVSTGRGGQKYRTPVWRSRYHSPGHSSLDSSGWSSGRDSPGRRIDWPGRSDGRGEPGAGTRPEPRPHRPRSPSGRGPGANRGGPACAPGPAA